MRLLAVAAVSIMSGACDDSSPAPPAAPSRSTPPASPPLAEPPQDAGRCENEQRVLDEGEILGGRVRGDVDGDGSPDEVYVVADPEATGDCRNFLVVEFEGQRIATPTNDEGVEHALPAPRIHALVQIDGEGGEEVLVDLEQGASTQFLGMFTFLDGALRRVQVAEITDFGNLFPYGGSVGHLEASNCSDRAGADVSVAVATANTTDYTIRTRLYEMRGARLVPLPREDQPRIMVGSDLDRIQGFATSPFGDCPQGGGGGE